MTEKSQVSERSVISTLRPKINYTPPRTIYQEDCDIELSVYEIQAFDTDFLVVLGKPKYTFREQGVLFVPIYFIPPKNQDKKRQIGVYEYEQDRAIELLDQEGDLDISTLTPLFFPWAEKTIQSNRMNVTEFLSKQTRRPSAEEEEAAAVESDQESTSSSDDEDIFHVSKSSRKAAAAAAAATTTPSPVSTIFTERAMVQPPPTLPKETASDAQAIKTDFAKSHTTTTKPTKDTWVQHFMQNPYYHIHEVEDNGDCFFATIRDAYKSIGYDTTVEKLRDILVQKVTYDIFQENRKLFLDLEGSKKEYDRELKQMKTGTQSLKTRFKVASTEERNTIRSELADLTKKYSDVMEYRQNTDTIIKESMGDLTGIDTFDQYKAYMKTSRYWADAWAISTLEQALKMKVIIFSEASYQEDALHSVLNCGEVSRDIDTIQGFEPKHYIMVSYNGTHYNLISYKNKKILTFAEIPYDVKTMIVNKCIEKNAGIYYLIDDFRQFKQELNIQPDVGAPEREPDVAAATGEETEGEAVSSVDLYDASVVFRFFAKSEKTALPGKGAGETIPKEKIVDYKDLKTVADWRRKLDDSWVDDKHPLSIDGKTYASVEHYYQASKFRFEQASKANLDFAELFALESGHRIARDVALAMAAGGKSGKYRSKTEGDKKDTVLRPKEVQIDPQFYTGRNVLERKRALKVKYEQNPEMKRLLQMTKRAKLVHYIAKQPPEVDKPLMEVRHLLR